MTAPYHLFVFIVLQCVMWMVGPVACIQEGVTVTDSTFYPFYVMLGNPHVCGGTLLSLNPPKVMTAAHCVMNSTHPSELMAKKQKNPYFVGYSHADRRQQRLMSIIDWVIHPSYDIIIDHQHPQEYDIAILTLATPLAPSRYVKKATIWSPALLDRHDSHLQGTLIGYGYKAFNQPESIILQRMSLQVNDYQPLTNSMVNAIATFDVDNRMACHGDSGSPLIVEFMQHPFVIGTLARIYGVHDPNPDHPTCPVKIRSDATIIESFVNLVPLLPWISQETNQTIEQLTTPSTEESFDENQDDWATAPSLYRHTKPSALSLGSIGRLFLFNSYPSTDDDDYRQSTVSFGIGHALLPNMVSSSVSLYNHPFLYYPIVLSLFLFFVL